MEQLSAACERAARAEWRLNVNGQQESARERRDDCVRQSTAPLKPKDGLNGPPSLKAPLFTPAFGGLGRTLHCRLASFCFAKRRPLLRTERGRVWETEIIFESASHFNLPLYLRLSLI